MTDGFVVLIGGSVETEDDDSGPGDCRVCGHRAEGCKPGAKGRKPRHPRFIREYQERLVSPGTETKSHPPKIAVVVARRTGYGRPYLSEH